MKSVVKLGLRISPENQAKIDRAYSKFEKKLNKIILKSIDIDVDDAPSGGNPYWDWD